MSVRKKILTSAAVLVAVGVLAALGTYGAFTATTSNSGNNISSGTVSLADSDGGTTAYNVANTAPNTTQPGRCLRVTYGGSLAATVKFYRAPGPLSNGDDYTLRVERGSGLTGPAADMNCAGFTAAADVYNGDLGSLGTTYGGGLDAKGSAWSSGNTVDYRFTITTKDDPAANNHTGNHATGSHDFVWEANSN